METRGLAKTKGLFLEHDIVVRTYDIDYAGHVSNIAYLRWLEDMRNMMFDKYFPLEMFMKDGIGPVIASTHIEYKRAINLFDKPHGFMWISKMGNASLTIEAEFTVGGALATTAQHVGVFINLATGRPVRLPEICRKKFEETRTSESKDNVRVPR